MSTGFATYLHILSQMWFQSLNDDCRSAGSLRSSQESSSSANSSKQLLAGPGAAVEEAGDGDGGAPSGRSKSSGRIRSARIRVSSIAPEPDAL